MHLLLRKLKRTQPQRKKQPVTPRSHYPGLARVFSTQVIELGLALVHTTASDMSSIVQAPNNN